MQHSPEEVWMGTLDVAPQPGNRFLAAAVGAIVNVMAVTSSPRGFRRKVYALTKEDQFNILNVSNAEPLEPREEFFEPGPELQLLARTVCASKATGASTYQAYLRDDED